MTHPNPHASYREHVSSEAEAVEENDFVDMAEAALVIQNLRAQLATARKALEPFEAFMGGHTFEKLPDDFEITHGSSLARRQLTVGDLKQLVAALNSGEQK